METKNRIRTLESYRENYRNRLGNFRKYIRKSQGEMTCVDLLDTLVNEVITLYPEQEEVIIRTLSKDFSRYFEPWNSFRGALYELSKIPSSSVGQLRRKLVNSKTFFKEVWKEDSDEFFRSRKMFSEIVKELELVTKINQTFDCIITSLFRNLIDKYGQAD